MVVYQSLPASAAVDPSLQPVGRGFGACAAQDSVIGFRLSFSSLYENVISFDAILWFQAGNAWGYSHRPQDSFRIEVISGHV